MVSFIPWGHDLATLVGRYGPRVAISSAEGTFSFDQLGNHAAAIAAHLATLDTAPGEPVGTLLRNRGAAVWASYGVTLSGAAETPLTTDLTASEVEYAVRLVGMRHVIADEASAPVIRAAGAIPHVADAIARGPGLVDPKAGAAGETWGRIVFTSGTTGRPKAIVHSHARRWLATLLLRAYLPFQPETSSRILLMTPFAHGSSLLAFAFLASGASVHLVDGVRLEEVRRVLEAGEVDSVFAPPTVLAKLTAAFSGRRFERIRAVFCGTSNLAPDLYRKAREMFGPVVRVTYGKSEVFNPITVLGPAECDAFYQDATVPDGCANLGWPAAGVEIQIRDESGRACPTGVDGEIHIRSPHMMIGHLDEGGFHPIHERNFHQTGDIGHLTDSGALFLVGRAHDVIKSGGYKIYPQEIETAVAGAVSPGVAVAVGLPSAYWGEVLVVVAEGAPAGWEARAAQAAEGVAKPKRPRAWLSLPELPRAGQGKIQRARVAKLVLQRYRLEDGPHPTLVAL